VRPRVQMFFRFPEGVPPPDVPGCRVAQLRAREGKIFRDRAFGCPVGFGFKDIGKKKNKLGFFTAEPRLAPRGFLSVRTKKT